MISTLASSQNVPNYEKSRPWSTKIRDDFHRGTTQIMLCITLMDIGMTRGQNSLSCNSCYQAERFAATTVFLNAYLDNTTATQLVNFIGQILTHARYLYRGSR